VFLRGAVTLTNSEQNFENGISLNFKERKNMDSRDISGRERKWIVVIFKER